ncbi:MAG: DUF4870 domain-containing protein [Patescibacteria group bacterium]
MQDNLEQNNMQNQTNSPQPVSPSPSATSEPVGNTVQTNTTGLEPNVLAALSYAVSPLSGFVVLHLEKENPFVRFHAMQSAIMGVVGLMGMLASGFLSVVFIGVLLGPAIFLAYMYFWVVLMYKSYNNEEYEIPYIGKMARDRLQKM